MADPTRYDSNVITTVLVVDDEAGTRQGIQESVPWEDHGFRVVGAVASAYDALDHIERAAPDIVVLDIRMPEMDGIELLKIIRRTYPSIRVILISGYNEFEYAREAVSARAFCYILKPIDDAELLARASEARAELVRERRKLEEDDRLRSRYASWLPTIRNRLILRLVREPSSGTDALLEAAELGLSLDARSYRVVLLRTDELDESRESGNGSGRAPARNYRDYAVLDRAEEMWRNGRSAYPFRSDTAGGLLIANPDPEADCVARLEELRSWTNEVAGLAISIGVGPEVASISELRRSYAEAERALEARLVAGRNSVLLADRYSALRSQQSATLSFDGVLNSLEAEAVTAVKSADFEGAEGVVLRIVSELEGTLARCIEAKCRLLHQVVAFVIKLRLALDLDVPESVFTCADVESLAALTDRLRNVFLASRASWEERQNLQNRHIVTSAVDFLHRNINNDISLTRVAEALAVHPNYLSSVFKAGVGKRFVDYAREIKMGEAKRLLRETSLKVYEIAAAVQYQDVNHFTRTFKKLVGCSPSEYRDLL